MNTTNLATRPKRALLAVTNINDLAPATIAFAKDLEIWDMILEIFDKEHPCTLDRRIVLRRKIRETLLESYFDAAAVEAEAEREYVTLDAIRQTLILKTEKNVEINNATNFMVSGSLNTLGGALSLNEAINPFAGNFLQMMSGVVATGMSTYALKQQAGGHINGLDEPTVLAELFGRPTDTRSSFPESVWRFFHAQSVEDPSVTRVQRMEEVWIKRDHLEKHGSHFEKEKIDLVCGLKANHKRMSIDDLSDNIAMISDVSEMAARMTHHLRDLLHVIDTDLTED